MCGCKSAKSLYIVVENSEVLFLPADCASTGLVGMTTDTCGLFRNIGDTYPFFLSSNFFFWKLPPFPFSWIRENNVVTIVMIYEPQPRSLSSRTSVSGWRQTLSSTPDPFDDSRHSRCPNRRQIRHNPYRITCPRTVTSTNSITSELTMQLHRRIYLPRKTTWNSGNRLYWLRLSVTLKHHVHW